VALVVGELRYATTDRPGSSSVSHAGAYPPRQQTIRRTASDTTWTSYAYTSRRFQHPSKALTSTNSTANPLRCLLSAEVRAGWPVASCQDARV